MQRLDKEMHDFAMKEIPEYKNLTTSEKEVVRETLRFAREYGASRADQILYGRISAKSGLAIHLTDKVPGGDVAFFDGKNTIYLDANAPRTRSYKGVLGHEVWHKMFKSAKVRGLFQNALNNIDPDWKAEVKEMYTQHLRALESYTEEEIANISDEEVAAAYAEELFNNPHVWDIVLDGEPTLKDRVLAFFKLAPKKYSFAPEMDAAAKEWIREYKKVFDQLASENANKNTLFGTKNGGQNTLLRTKDAESADFDGVTSVNQQNMQVSGRSAVEIDSEGKTYWQIETEQDIFKNLKTVKELQNAAYNYILHGEKGSKVKDIIDGEELKFIRISAGEFVYGEDSTNLNETQYKQKMRMSTSILDLIRNATIKYDAPDHKNHKMFRAGFKNYQGRVGIDDTIFKYIVRVGKANNGKIFYDICLEVDGKVPRAKRTSLIKSSTSNGSISQKSQNDKGSDEISSKNVDSGGRAALADGKKETSSDVAAAKKDISEAGIDPRGIMALSDSYFDRYDGSLTRTGLRYEFLDAARTMLQSDGDAYDRAFAKIEAIAEELTLNERDGSGFVNDLKEIQRHIREITFEMREQDKGEFDSLGGFNEFRKKHFGKLNIANEGASVDSVYGELQTLYGLSLFPDQNTAQEMLIRISEVLDMDPKAQAAGDIDLKAAGADMAVELTQKILNSFENKLAAKAARMSKADAEAYKARINAKAEVKAAKAIAKAKKRLEALAEQMKKGNAKLQADYKTDTVFSQAAVDRALSESKALGSLPKGMKKTLAEEIFLDMNESLNEGERYALRAEYTVKIMDAILGNEKGEYFGATVMQRTQLRDEVSDMMRRISEAGKASKRKKRFIRQCRQ